MEEKNPDFTMSNDELAEPPLLLMNGGRIKRAVDRMAYQIAEDRGGDARIAVMGIKKRGYAIAKLLAEKLSLLADGKVMLIQLSDFDEGQPTFKAEHPAELPKKIEYGVLVDDVIFSGQTMLDAIRKTSRQFNPSILRTAVLVDRGHRSMPVEASFTGMQLPTKLDEHVSVQLRDDGLEKVVLTKK
jgi:pyrimidine operon attenuation protein/uracil phosphoribosyltransferase